MALQKNLQNGQYGFADDQLTVLKAPCYDQANDFHETVATVKYNQKWWLIDQDFKEIKELSYDLVAEFQEGYAEVIKDNLYGYIDLQGNEIIPCNYKCIYNTNGLFEIQDQKGKWGLATRQNEILLPCEYDALDGVKKELYITRKGTFTIKGGSEHKLFDVLKKEFIDVQYDYIASPSYSSYNLRGHYVCVGLHKGSKFKYGVLNFQFQEVVPCEYDELGDSFSGTNCFVVINDGKQGLFNLDTQKEILPCIYDSIRESYWVKNYLILENGKQGLFDIKNVKVASPCSFHNIEQCNGKFVIDRDTNWRYGLFDLEGKELLTYNYSRLEFKGAFIELTDDNYQRSFLNAQLQQTAYISIHNGMALNATGKWCLLDPEGNEISDFIYDDNDITVYDFGFQIRECNGTRYTILNNKGEVIIPLLYEDAKLMSYNDIYYYSMKFNQHYCVIDLSQNNILPFEYEALEYIYNNKEFIAKKDEKYGIVDFNNEIKVPFEYTYIYYKSQYYYGVTSIDGMKGYMDKEDYQTKILYPCDAIQAFGVGGYYEVKKEELYGIINTKGQEILPTIYDEIRTTWKEHLIFVKSEGKWGCVNLNNDVLIPLIYDEIENFETGLIAKVSQDGLYGFVTAFGEEFIHCSFEELSFEEDYFKVQKEKLWGYLNLKGEEFVPCVFKSESKAKDLLDKIYINKTLNTEAIKKLYTSKKADDRVLGSHLLVFEHDLENGLKLYHNESNESVKLVLLPLVASSIFGTWQQADWQKHISSQTLKEHTFKPAQKLFWKDGTTLTEKEIDYIFYRQQLITSIKLDLELQHMMSFLKEEGRDVFSKELLDQYYNPKLSPDLKYILTLIGYFGTDSVVDQLQKLCVGLVDNKKYAMAVYVVESLGLVGTDKAIRSIDALGRKYRVKPSNVGAATRKTLKQVAEQRQIDIDTLSDLIVPGFEFTDLFYPFEADGLQYKAFLGSDGKLKYLTEDGSSLKKQPKGIAKPIMDHFKVVEKESKATLKTQTLRMEQYLMTQRQWATQAWLPLFLKNPILFNYASSLVWRWEEGSGLVKDFIVQEDQTLMNKDYEEVNLSESGTIKLLHTIELSVEERNQWQSFLKESAISPLIPQMERLILKFDPEAIKGSSFTMTHLSRFKKAQWKPYVGDAGIIDDLSKTFGTVKVTLDLGGDGYVSVYGDLDEKTTVAGIYLSKEQEQISAIVLSELAAELHTLLH